jgi:hypothetical protein
VIHIAVSMILSLLAPIMSWYDFRLPSNSARGSTLASAAAVTPKRWTFHHDVAGGYKLTNRIRDRRKGEAIIGKVAGRWPF